jgi:hypothetical protein
MLRTALSAATPRYAAGASGTPTALARQQRHCQRAPALGRSAGSAQTPMPEFVRRCAARCWSPCAHPRRRVPSVERRARRGRWTRATGAPPAPAAERRGIAPARRLAPRTWHLSEAVLRRPARVRSRCTPTHQREVSESRQELYSSEHPCCGITPKFSCGASCRARETQPSIVRGVHGHNLMPSAPSAATLR